MRLVLDFRRILHQFFKQAEVTHVIVKHTLYVASFFLFLISTASSLDLVYAEQQNTISDTKTWKTNVNKQIQLVADITNNKDIRQPFVYIIQIQDTDGKVVLLDWMQGVLQPHQSMSPAQSWTPTKSGIYTAQMFDWPCLDNCGALSEPLQMNIVVT